MNNIIESIKDRPSLRKIEINELQFIEFKCIVEQEQIDMWTECNYIVYVSTGKKLWKSKTNNYILNPGNAIFVKKGAHSAYQFFDEEFCALYIFVPDEYIKKVITKFDKKSTKGKKYIDNTDSVIPIHINSILKMYFESVISYFDIGNELDKDLALLKFEEFVLTVLSLPQCSELSSYFYSLGAEIKYRLQSAVEQNCLYPLKLEDYSKLCGMSLSSFKQIFKSVYNQSPAKWIRERKIEMSHRLLTTTDKNVNQIAFEIGFNDSSHFIKVFKKYYKSTPLQVRQGKL